MPSQKPRVALTLPPELRAVLQELAEVSARPVSSIIVELLTEMRPQLEGIIKITRATKAGNKQAAKQAAVHMFGDAMAEVLAIQQPELFGTPTAKKARKS